MATYLSLRLGCRNYSRTIVVRTLYLQRQGRLHLAPCRLLSVAAIDELKSNANSSTGEMFQPTDVITDASRGAEATGDVATEAASSVTHEIVDLSSVGLGGYWPPGLIQSALEIIHNHAHLPWWACIVALTFALRLVMLPVNVRMQQVGATIANLNKDAVVLHARIQACKAAGDKVGESQAGIEILKLYQKHNAHPLQMFPLAFAQVPVFLSMLYGLRGMAALPLESFRTGGMWWFTDLVIPDPIFCLPLIACGSFLINIELGGEGGATTDNDLSNRLRWVMRIGAICILPITVSFPSAVLMYWVSNSMFSTFQILFFKLHSVKKLFGIPILIKKNK